jgi:hypothetical protein
MHKQQQHNSTIGVAISKIYRSIEMRYYKDSCYGRHTEMLTNNMKDNLNFSTLPENNSKRHTESNSKIGPLLAIDINHRACRAGMHGCCRSDDASFHGRAGVPFPCLWEP